MLRKRKKKTLRQVDKIIEKINSGETVEKTKITDSIFFDALNELKKLDGEAYIKSAAVVLDVLNT